MMPIVLNEVEYTTVPHFLHLHLRNSPYCTLSCDRYVFTVKGELIVIHAASQ